MIVIMAFGILWVLNFIGDKTNFIYMISASQYYYSSDSQREGSARVLQGIWISYTKHAGSIALGSLVHMFVVAIRIVVDSIVSAADNGGENGVAVVVGCLLKCCLASLESLVEYLNTMAYAYMAISGDPYCTSAWNGFILNLKQMLKFYFASTLASAFIFIGMLTITGVNTGTFYLIVKYGTNSGYISSIWPPLAIIFITSFITSGMFLGIFEKAITATLMCLAVDLELNNGEPKFGPPSFHVKL